ncbi:4-hydroxybenzoate transporter PcaK [Paraburkholderia phenoliruptrix]|uniref:MFS transporter, metabolite:H+ symporter n=3 Tax=Paraburkholderia phenoliruptrix TaxID=252970 RepID=K0DZ19_9BURK|nr:MFS transporter [Paraburkholderia phenoliruptrix]AFT88679.1 MFS transporter, metabolite:H+ symporter [Paraburkholderia phenoliruptrix BR3459a]MDR6418947.1 putative MFS transporter [Paraburkholderia phenoliruptrix]CAB4047615.1 4-hydroxybenzoate transporter PcaK [Paraburkholderia phenoliruptrix]
MSKLLAGAMVDTDHLAIQKSEPVVRAANLLFRIENVPFSRWHTKARIIMGSATFFDAFDALSLAFALPVLVGLWHLSPMQIGFLIAAGYLGQFVGALTFGWVAERFGRVPSATTTVGVMSVMGIACAFSGNLQLLFLARFLQGIGVGGEVPVAAAYISELSQAHGRGRFFILYELIFPLGLLGAAQVGAFVVPRFGWEWMFLVGAIPGIVVTLFIARLPESPRWLISKGRYDDAERVVERIEASTTRRNLDVERDWLEVERRLSKIRDASQSRRKASWKELFSSVYRGRTLVVWVLWASSYFVANGINNWLPSLYRTVYHLPLQESLHMASLSNVLSACAVLLCAFLVDRTGRRKWAMGTFLVSGALLLALGMVANGGPWAVMILGSSAYAVMGTTTVMLYLYTPEIYPTRMRAIGTGLATSWLRIASAAAPAIVGFVLSGHGISAVFPMFAATTVVGLLAAGAMIETSNRSLEEISP